MSHPRPVAPVVPRTSEFSALRPLGLDSVTITSGEWSDWQKANRATTIPHTLDWLERDGTVDNLRRLDPDAVDASERRGLWFTDSDLYKELEGIGWELGAGPSPELEDALDRLSTIVSRAQEPDGYLNSFVQAGLDVRWDNLVKSHEHYCIGHLAQAAIAAVRTTGRTELLEVTERAVALIVADFADGRRHLVDGHEEIEMALVELYRETGRREYLDLAQQFVDDRGHGILKPDQFDSAYFQDSVPVREQGEVTGHAVRAVYLLAGVVDLYLETGETALLDAAIRQWETMTARKSYVTGALGSRFEGEAFGDDYELPPDLAYGETCATIGNMMLSWRLLLATGESRFADTIERGLYNLFAASTSVERTAFFYNNPAQRRVALPASPLDSRPNRAAAPGTRPVWFECACCPPNIVRTIASLAAYVSTTTDAGVQLHQYLPTRIDTRGGGRGVLLSVETAYPLDGGVVVRVEESPTEEWTLSLRIPGWAPAVSVTVDGVDVAAEPNERGYVELRRAWEAGDVVELRLPMEPRLSVAHPAVDALRGTVAVERGPVVYALESPDQGASIDVNSVALAVDRPLTVEPDNVLGRTVAVVRATGVTLDASSWPTGGYARLGAEPPIGRRAVDLRFIPYALWANRGPSIMRIHVPSTTAEDLP
jgi:DUF1680 family protein